MKQKKIVIIFIIITLFSSCMVETERFYYISMVDRPSVEVLKYGEVKISGLMFNSVIPLKYQLARNDYILLFEVPDYQKQPTIYIRIKGKGGKSYKVDEAPATNVPSELVDCGSLFIYSSRAAVNADADSIWRTDCISPKIEKKIIFNILDNKGKYIRTEMLEFDLIKDGFYTYLDAV